MTHFSKLLALGLLTSSLAAQEKDGSSKVEPVLSQRDTAFIFIAVATYLADSLPSWYRGKSFQLDIPQFPKHAGLQGSLAGALGRTPFLLQCADLVHCPRGQDRVVGLDSLQKWYGDVKVSIKMPIRPFRGWVGSPGVGWTWPQWEMAAESELFLNMAPYMVGGCTVPMPRTMYLRREPQGWVVVQTITSLRLCA